MKVTRNTPEQLIVDHHALVLASIATVLTLGFCILGVVIVADGSLIGLLFVAVGLGAGGGMLGQTERVQVILDRAAETLTIRRRNILRYNETEHTLSALDRADIETSRYNNATTYRVTLVLTSDMSAGKHPVTEVYSSSPNHKRVADAINAWLGRERSDAQA